MKTYSELKEDSLPTIKEYTPELLVSRIQDAVASHPEQPRLAMLADIDAFKCYFDEYGPEQRLIVLGNVNDYFSHLKKKHEISLIDRMKIDQFFLLAPMKDGLAERIRQDIDQMRFPKHDLNSTEVPLEDGRTISPNHVTVHIGQIGFIPNQSLDYRTMLFRLHELTRGIGADKTLRKDWNEYSVL